jgi:hypothetical protein
VAEGAMQLVCVPPDQVARAWPHVRDLIVAAMKRGGLSSYRPVEDAVLRGDALLWLAIPREDGRQRPGALRGLCRKRPDGDEARIAAAAVTELHETEWRKVCVLVACGGAGMSGWIELLDGIEAYARAAGCEAMRLMGREGWQRLLPSYRRTGIVLERTL